MQSLQQANTELNSQTAQHFPSAVCGDKKKELNSHTETQPRLNDNAAPRVNKRQFVTTCKWKKVRGVTVVFHSWLRRGWGSTGCRWKEKHPGSNLSATPPQQDCDLLPVGVEDLFRVVTMREFNKKLWDNTACRTSAWLFNCLVNLGRRREKKKPFLGCSSADGVVDRWNDWLRDLSRSTLLEGASPLLIAGSLITCRLSSQARSRWGWSLPSSPSSYRLVAFFHLFPT